MVTRSHNVQIQWVYTYINLHSPNQCSAAITIITWRIKPSSNATLAVPSLCEQGLTQCRIFLWTNISQIAKTSEFLAV